MKPLFLLIPLLFFLSGCGGKSAQPAAAPDATPAPLTLTSPAFAQGAAIPAQYTCDGNDSSPALEWSAPPAGTKSLALVMDDPDAPMGTWVHWVVYNLPADATGLAEGASKGEATAFNLPAGTIQGVTSFKRSDYGGPCPPSGTHHYEFRLYALDLPLEQTGLNKAGLLDAMKGHVLAAGELMGTYSTP